ncbi:MAG: hypothetical protein ACRD2U_11440 [Terriglobales bacterium]
MTGPDVNSWRSKSIAGAALAGLGVFLLYVNLAAAIGLAKHLFCDHGYGELGVLPSIVLFVSHVLRSYASNPHGFVQGFILQAVVSFWPLVLVIVGTALSRNTSAGNAKMLSKIDCRIVELTGGHSTLE